MPAILIFIAMITRQQDGEMRSAIRSTWGAQRSVLSGDVQYRFFLPFACCEAEPAPPIALCDEFPFQHSCVAAKQAFAAVADSGNMSLNSAWDAAKAGSFGGHGHVNSDIDRAQWWRDLKVSAMRWALSSKVAFTHFVHADSDSYVCGDTLLRQPLLRLNGETVLGYRRKCG